MRLTPALLLLLTCSVPAAELGRVFFTPGERARMEGRIPAQARLQGVVQRTDGARTVWLDGRRYRDVALPSEAEAQVHVRLKQARP